MTSTTGNSVAFVLAVLLAALGFSVVTSGCGSSARDEVIFADSFETDSTLFGNGWGHAQYDSVRIVPGDCPGGGPHAVRLSTGLEGPGSGLSWVQVFRSLPEAETGDRLELTAWVKVLSDTGMGEVGFCTVDTVWTTCWASTTGNSPSSSTRKSWTRVSNVFRNDSGSFPPRISLHAIGTIPGRVTILFDRVEVKRLAARDPTNPASF